MSVIKLVATESPRTEFAEFEETLERAAALCSLGDEENLALRLVSKYEADNKELADALSAMGFRHFAPLAAGTSGVTLQTTSGQVIRISHKERILDSRPQVHEQLQPILTGETSNYTFEVLPRLDTNVSKEHAATFMWHVSKKQYWPNDFRHDGGDLGYLPDGTVVGIDINSMKFTSEPTIMNDEQWLIASDQESIFPYLKGSGFISKQEYFYPALRDGRPRGVLSDNDIARLRHGELEQMRIEKPECFEGVTCDNLSEFILLVKDFGWYPSQALEIMIGNGHAKPTLSVEPTGAAFRDRVAVGQGGQSPN